MCAAEVGRVATAIAEARAAGRAEVSDEAADAFARKIVSALACDDCDPRDYEANVGLIVEALAALRFERV